MTITKDFASKAAVAFVAVAMVFSMFAPSAKAQSTEDLQAMINNLLAQIASLQSQVGQGGTSVASGVCPYTWTRDLNVGATGADVMKLQQFLNANADTRVAASGAGSVGAETEFYGPATAAAVSKMQVMYRAEILSPAGLVNPTGYFGPSTRAKANALCVAAPVVNPGETDGETDGGTQVVQ
ncbi:MAG: peptidoglycan-binding domain-containing protein [Candidatus Paceibacterota bacterium]